MNAALATDQLRVYIVDSKRTRIISIVHGDNLRRSNCSESHNELSVLFQTHYQAFDEPLDICFIVQERTSARASIDVVRRGSASGAAAELSATRRLARVSVSSAAGAAGQTDDPVATHVEGRRSRASSKRRSRAGLG